MKNNRKNANVNATSLEESIRKFVNEAKNKIAFVERRLSNFILELCAQIVDLRIKVNGPSELSELYFIFLILILN